LLQLLLTSYISEQLTVYGEAYDLILLLTRKQKSGGRQGRIFSPMIEVASKNLTPPTRMCKCVTFISISSSCSVVEIKLDYWSPLCCISLGGFV
jgi:hypothetical protein